MNKIFVIVLILLHSFNLFSQEKNGRAITKIQGSKEVPLELNLLIDSLGNLIDQNKILPSIMNIDSYARLLSKEDIFLIGKVEIYKTLLKTYESFPKATVDGNSTYILKLAIKKTKDPFIKWFIQALLQDCESLLSSPNYKDYLLQKNNGRLERIELKKIDKKVQLIYRWISKINPDSPEFEELFQAELIPSMIDSLINIEQTFFLMATGTIFEPFPGLIKSPSELKFFALKTTKAHKKTVVKDKSVEDILAPITGVSPVDAILPEPSKDDWLNQDNAPLNLKNLPKPSDDADWLQDF